MHQAHRILCLAFVAIAGAFTVRMRPGQLDSPESVLRENAVLAFLGAGALLLLLAFLPQRFFTGWRERGWLLRTVPALGLLAGLLWVGDQIDDAYLSVAQYVLALALATALWSRVTDDRGPLLLSSLWLCLGIVLFGSELPGDDHGRPVSVLWGDDQTFVRLFAKRPPYIGPGGRMRPDVDAYMHAKDLPQGARLQTNSLGFRNAEEVAKQPAPGTLRVLSLGDSFSIGMQSGQRDFLGARLESGLTTLRAQPVEVVNVEISDPAYGLYYFQAYGHEYGARIVLLGLCANDMLQVGDSFGDGRLFQLDTQGRLVPESDPPRVEGHVHRYAELAYPTPSDRIGTYVPERFDFGSFSRRMQSKLLRFRALRLLVPTDARRRSAPALMPSYAKKYEQVDGRMRYFDGTANLGYFARPPLSVMEGLYAKLSQVLGALDEQVRASGGELVLALYPQRFQVHPEDWAVIRDFWGLAEEDFDLDLHNRRLRELCAERGIACLDLLEAFRAEADGGPLYISGGDMHFNNAGHALAARELAAFLQNVPGD